MLCFLCRKICVKSLDSTRALQHHVTFRDLQEAVDKGCELCELFRTSLLHYYAEDMEGTLEMAEKLHLDLDSQDVDANETDRRVFYLTFIEGRMDAKFGPWGSNIHGLTFTREASSDGVEPVRSVYPFLKLAADYNTTACQEGWIIGNEISELPDFSLGNRWISECREGHKECADSSESQLPPRVIDVGPPDGSEIPRLVLCEGTSGEYATLSHCWGGLKPMVTDSTTLKANLEKIPFSDLPKTFQDAVITTRQLGLRYLWIDSLCIIQDSQEDWERHCARMPEIYKNSTVTVAGPGAIDCTSGFLQPREKPLSSVGLEIRNGEVSGPVTLSYCGTISAFYPGLEKDSPLSNRAWVLQERLLSRRVLYFGTSFMYFECCTNARHETLHFPFQDYYQERNEAAKTSFRVEHEPSVWLQYWNQIVTTYSQAALTFPSDRLPALSGIAREIQRKIRDKYIAGLWCMDLPIGLMWFIHSSEKRSGISKEHGEGPPPYIAPSWSWASVSSGVSFCNLNYQDHVLVSPDLRILHAHTEVRGLDAFGKVQKGSLVLEGKCQSFIVRVEPHRFISDRMSFHVYSGNSQRLGEYHPDEYDIDFRGQTRTGSIPHIWFEETITLLYLGHFEGSVRQWVALAIEPIVGTEGQYRRVGLTSGSSPDFAEIGIFFDGVEKRRLEII